MNASEAHAPTYAQLIRMNTKVQEANEAVRGLLALLETARDLNELSAFEPCTTEEFLEVQALAQQWGVDHE